jgi:hypothetical protein
VVAAVGEEEVADAEHHVLEAGDAHQLRGAPGLGQPGVQAGLHVDVVVARPRLLHHLQVTGVAAEVLADDARQHRPFPGPRRADDRPHAAADQPADVRQLRTQIPVGGRSGGGNRLVRGVATAHSDLRIGGGGQ